MAHLVSRRNVLMAPSALSLWGSDAAPRVAVIGAGARGRYHIGQFRELGANVAWVCDVYQTNRDAALAVAGSGAQGCEDYRKVLDDRSVDAVVIATPDHLHARMAIAAMRAGKDVYLEKPVAHTIEDGFRVVEAARDTKRIVQVGMQRRSMNLFKEALSHVGASTGSVKLVNSWWYNRIDKLNPGPLKGALNWDLFLGLAPKRPPDPVRFLNWYWFWDYGGGMMVAQASHIIDAVVWLLGLKYPAAVTATGNGPSLALAETPPNTCMCVEYPGDLLVVFTVGYHAMQYPQRFDQLIQFHGSKGRLDLGREAYALYSENPKSSELTPSLTGSEPGSFAKSTALHIREFLECVRSRKEPGASPEAAQFTNVALCMASESLRLGRRIVFDEQTRRIKA